jgi:hypothetical protein
VTARPGLLLADAVRGQFDRLAGWAALPPRVAQQAGRVLEALTEGALQRPAVPPFDGLSRINANGLPFQWSFSFAPGAVRSLRFLCEPGVPGASGRQRFSFAGDCLARALDGLGIAYPSWLEDCVFAHLVPPDDAWPRHWRSALWFGVGAAPGGVLVKPYVNLNWGMPLERWRRIGRVFQALGRHDQLAALCDLSGRVSRDSWPVGLALDVLPDGRCGRVKIYFRSAPVGTDWLQRWYLATGGGRHAPTVRAALDAFPLCGQARYPGHAFIVSLEFHDAGIALKTDLAVTRWMPHDAAIAAGARRVLGAIGGDADELQAALQTLGAWPPDETGTRHLRFVGLGHEPDGACHLNLYVEPPLERPRMRAVRRPPGGVIEALRAATAFLCARQDGGLWRDYALPVGVADQWITAYALWLLAGLPAQCVDDAARSASAAGCTRLLELAGPDGGWGYHAGTGSDADSTSLAVLALRAHGHPAPQAALDFLESCRAPDGGMGTYPPGSSPGGTWCQGSCEVSGAAWLALEGDAALGDFLAQRRCPDGQWPAYWWHTPLYPTWLALCIRPCREGDPLFATLQRFEPIGTFETALLLLCCERTGLKARAGELAQQLIASQLTDGSWGSSALLRLTHTQVAAPAEAIDAGPSFLDQARIFTSATALAALAAHLRPGPFVLASSPG